jgi:hypothetical protein
MSGGGSSNCGTHTSGALISCNFEWFGLQVVTECNGDVRLVAGNTGAGVYYNWPTQKRLISVIQASDAGGMTKSRAVAAAGDSIPHPVCFMRHTPTTHPTGA